MSDRIDFGGQPWQAIPRDLLRDPNLSVKAKGALVNLLSHDEGWIRSVIGILMKENAGLGRDGAQALMKELVDRGYAERHTTHDSTGKFRTSYVVRPHRLDLSVGSEPGTSLSPQPAEPATAEPATAETSAVVEPLEVEPREEEPKSEEMARASSRDLLFELLYLVQVGRPYKPGQRMTSGERGKINNAVKLASDAGYSDEDVVKAISGWPTAMGDTRITALALVGQLERCMSAAEGAEFRRPESRPTMMNRAADALREMQAELSVGLRREEMRIATEELNA
jgi:hypothetical protein